MFFGYGNAKMDQKVVPDPLEWVPGAGHIIKEQILKKNIQNPVLKLYFAYFGLIFNEIARKYRLISCKFRAGFNGIGPGIEKSRKKTVFKYA